MTRDLAIVGCGGFGREVHAIAHALAEAGHPWRIAGFYDDGASDEDRIRVRRLGATVAGTIDDLAANARGLCAVVAIGSPAVRRAVSSRLDSAGVRWAVLVHPSATLGPDTELGPGTVVAAGARLTTNVRIGHHVHIDQAVTVGHDVVIEDFSRLNPQAAVSGSVIVGAGALVGANATVLQGLRVGDGAVVGAGAVVVRDVPPGTTVKGVPAR